MKGLIITGVVLIALSGLVVCTSLREALMFICFILGLTCLIAAGIRYTTKHILRDYLEEPTLKE